ncbi:peptidylprolyl isomerase, partial [Klebsiella pneumoniae]|nr:peptidylprolyl isomerase [Klebsiella pneumoniae]
ARPQIVRYLTYEGVRRLLEQLRDKAKVDILLPGGTGAGDEEPASAPSGGLTRPAPAPAPPSASDTPLSPAA